MRGGYQQFPMSEGSTFETPQFLSEAPSGPMLNMPGQQMNELSGQQYDAMLKQNREQAPEYTGGQNFAGGPSIAGAGAAATTAGPNFAGGAPQPPRPDFAGQPQPMPPFAGGPAAEPEPPMASEPNFARGGGASDFARSTPAHGGGFVPPGHGGAPPGHSNQPPQQRPQPTPTFAGPIDVAKPAMQWPGSAQATKASPQPFTPDPTMRQRPERMMRQARPRTLGPAAPIGPQGQRQQTMGPPVGRMSGMYSGG